MLEWDSETARLPLSGQSLRGRDVARHGMTGLCENQGEPSRTAAMFCKNHLDARITDLIDVVWGRLLVRDQHVNLTN